MIKCRATDDNTPEVTTKGTQNVRRREEGVAQEETGRYKIKDCDLTAQMLVEHKQ